MFSIQTEEIVSKVKESGISSSWRLVTILSQMQQIAWLTRTFKILVGNILATHCPVPNLHLAISQLAQEFSLLRTQLFIKIKPLLTRRRRFVFTHYYQWWYVDIQNIDTSIQNQNNNQCSCNIGLKRNWKSLNNLSTSRKIIFFGNEKGVLLVYSIERRTTIMGDVYCETPNDLGLAIQKKTPETFIRYNAPSSQWASGKFKIFIVTPQRTCLTFCICLLLVDALYSPDIYDVFFLSWRKKLISFH